MRRNIFHYEQLLADNVHIVKFTGYAKMGGCDIT